MKGRIDKLDFKKIKKFFFVKYPVKWMKRQAIEWRKYLKVLYIANRGLVSKVYKELSNQIIQLEKWAKDANRPLPQENM